MKTHNSAAHYEPLYVYWSRHVMSDLLPPLATLLHLVPRLDRPELLRTLAIASALREVCLICLQQMPAASVPTGDTLLSVKEAAGLLHISRDYLYKNRHRYPFCVQVGRRVLCSTRGMHDWLTQQQAGGA